MSPGDKKGIVDKIFGFSVINQMLEIVKREKREVKAGIKSIEDELGAISDSIQATQRKLEILEKNAKEQNSEKIEELKKKLADLVEAKNKLEEAKNTIKKQQIEKENGLKDDRKSLISRESNKRKLEKELDLFKNDQCPTCHADLKSDFHLGLKEKLEKEKSENEEELKGVRDRVSAVEKEITEIRNKETKVISKISDLNSKIQSFKSDLLDLAKKMDKGEHGEFQSLIEEFKAKERTKTSKKTELTSEEHFYGVLETMLGDDGIKNMAMKMILPSLNANISQMTRTLGIPFNISFDNKFDSVITHLGEEVNPKTLSTGEKKKADFAIIIALIKMMKMRFPSLNVLFLDEIFSSVDSDGIYHILGIIHETIKEAKINAFVINHTILPSELFDKKIEITKDSGFSELSIEAIS